MVKEQKDMKYKGFLIEDSGITTGRRHPRTGAQMRGTSPLYQIRNSAGDIIHNAGEGEFLTSHKQAKEWIDFWLETTETPTTSITTPSGNTVYRTRSQAQKHRPHGYKIVQVYDGYIIVTPAGYRAIMKGRRG